MKNSLIVICGPTASGKTFFAHELAKQINAEIINADSMQLYSSLPIITASPSDELKNEIPYHLYNFLEINQSFSAAEYAIKAKNIVKQIQSENKTPILVGGSGLYIKSLTQGLVQIPQVNKEVRNLVINKIRNTSVKEVYDELISFDPKATKLSSNDTQRITRAYEVFLESGQSIFDFHETTEYSGGLSDCKIEYIFLNPERDFLRSMCKERLDVMLNSGAIDEVQSALSEELYRSPLFKALAVQEIVSYLAGTFSLENARNIALNKTRQYAKRQVTWFKNQLSSKQVVNFNSFDEFKEITNELIKQISQNYIWNKKH